MTLSMVMTFRYNVRYDPQKKYRNLYLIKIRNICSAKDNVKEIKRQVIYWKSLFENDISNR